jgi:hypothetical protein
VKIVKKTTPSLAERGLSRIDIINKAAKAKNDEFYTRYEDIEKELKMYDKGIWLDKTVFCNCDDAVDNDERRTSAFALYFLKNFKQLGLKKLICTHYSDIAGQGYYVDLFNQGSRGYIFTKDGFKELDYYIKCKEKPEGYNGSFDHPLSIKILNEKADIVVTNPPFSRAKDYWKLVIDSGKKFLILSNVDEPISNSSIHYFKNGQVWAGFHEVDEFLTPKHEITRAAAFWYTNLPIDTRPRYELLKFMPLDKIPEKYKRFDDEGMLLLDYSYIASDYDKPIAVSKSPILNGLLEKGYCIIDDKEYYKTTKGKLNYKRVLVQKI